MSRTAAVDGDLARGTRLGRYRIEEPVGRGGMGTVYAAYDETTRRTVAVKLLAPGLSAELRDRFLAECEAEANIRHENVMPVYDRGWLADDRPYFVMELLYEPITLTAIRELDAKGLLGIEHPRLRHWTDRRRLIHDVLLPLFEGVAVANAQYGMQHRDLKPDNVLVDVRTRRPYLIDFGICRRMDDPPPVRPVIVGTPRFLSPEQARGTVDPRTDVWGCGCLLHYVLTGEPPLERTSPFTRKEIQERVRVLAQAEQDARAKGREPQARGYAARRAQLEDPELRAQDDLLKDAREGRYLPLPTRVDPALAAVIQKAMAADPGARYPDVGALVADLKAWLAGRPTVAIQEGGRGDAAADAARRVIARYLLQGVAALVALGLGTLLGLGLFRAEAVTPDHRAADLAALEAAAPPEAGAPDAVADLAGLERRLAWREARARAQRRLGAGRASGSEVAQPLELIDWGASEWRVRRLLPPGEWRSERAAATAVGARPTGGGLRPARAGQDLFHGPALAEGVWQVQSLAPRGLSLVLPVLEPGARPGAALPGAIHLLALAEEVPPGMTWIPGAFEGFAGGEGGAPFLASAQPVTHYEYGEWLDELEPAERLAHLPPEGFQRDPSDPQRFVPEPARADRPVRGLAPRIMARYAAWRAEIEGRPWALPTAAQWQRMAGLDYLEAGGLPARLLPFGGGEAARAAWRGAYAPEPFPGAPDDDLSPLGVRGLYAGRGEVAVGPEGFVVKGAGGMLPRRAALAREQPIDADLRGHPYAFRLVWNPD